MGLVEKEERRPRGCRTPLPPKSELDKEGGGAPLSFPLSLSFPPSLSPTWQRGVRPALGGGAPEESYSYRE